MHRHLNGRVDRQARSLDDGQGLQHELAAVEADPEHEALRSERGRAVTGALMKLPLPLREVVVLRDYHGMAHDEIAGVVGARGNTVRKRYSRGLAELRRHLIGIIE